MNCFYTVSSKTASSITVIADSFNASIIKNIIILSKFVKTLKNVKFVQFLNTVITTVCLKTVFQFIAVLTVILNMQLDSSNTEFTKNS